MNDMTVGLVLAKYKNQLAELMDASIMLSAENELLRDYVKQLEQELAELKQEGSSEEEDVTEGAEELE